MSSRPMPVSNRKLIRQHQGLDRALPKVPCDLSPSVPPLDTSPNFPNCDENNSSLGYRYTLLPLYQYHSYEEPSPTSDTSDMSLPSSPCYQPEWIYRRLKSPSDNVAMDDPSWPAIIRPRAKAERSIPSLSPTSSYPPHTRPRGPSVSSIPSVATTSSSSSVSKPVSPQSKSILTRTSSASTKNSLVKSVKFVDMPTIHYGYDDYCEDSYDECEIDMSRPPTPPKGRSLQGFRRYIWPPKQNPSAPMPAISTHRPAISGPLALGSVHVDHSDNTSLRSIRSNESSRSDRSRRMVQGGTPLRTSRSAESFLSTRSGGNNKFRAFFGKMVH